MTDVLDWYGPETATFGDRLAAAREKTGMTQKLLAKRMGIKGSTLKAWENDSSEPRANRLSMMAGILGVSVMWLLTGEGEGVTNPEDEAPISAEVNDILIEIRDLKSSLSGAANKLSRLEKQLRLTLKEQ